MRKVLVSLLLLIIAVNSYAQNKASLKGILIDSTTKSPLEFATVAVVNTKDTTLISYSLTDKNGVFKLSGIPVDRSTKLIISYVGYNTIRRSLDLKKGEDKDFGTIPVAGKSLDEVVIQGARSPVVIKKDTIEFNTEAFKTRPNAVVEELLRKLPGVQVNQDGSILVNGKSINKLLIDGKQFFGSDPKVATKNLDADLIDKIQVYDDRENDPDHKLNDTEVGKIINLKLKSKIKKSTLGKVYAGGGSRDRYEAAGILSNFRDTLQISLIGLANNLTKTGFSNDDLYNMGGFGRSGGNQVWDGTFGGQGWGGMENIASAGFNINNDYGKKLKMNLVYFYTNTKRINNGSSFDEQQLNADTLLSSSSGYDAKYINNKHSLGGLIEWNPDTLNRFRYEPKFEMGSDDNNNSGRSNSFNNLNAKLNETRSNGIDRSNNNSFSHGFSYYRRLKKKGESLNINHSLNLNKNTSDGYNYNDLVSYTESIRSEIQDRYADHNTNSNSANISVNYNFPITKDLSAELTSNTSYNSNSDLLSTFDKNKQTSMYDLFLPNQSNELNRNTFVQSIKPQLNYQIGKSYNVRIGLSAELQTVKNEFNNDISDINQKYYNFFPALQFSGPSFSINFNETLEQPQIYQMQPVVREYSQLYKYTGNPNLKAGRNYQFSGNLYKYNYSKQINFNAYTSVTLSENNIVQKTTIDGNLARTSTYVNRKGGSRAYLSGSIGKQFKKSQNWQVGLNTSLNANGSTSAFFLNADEGKQLNYSFGARQSISFNYNELLSINTTYNFSNSTTEYKDVDYKTINTYTHSAGTDFSLRWPKRVIIDAKYNYNYNPQVAAGFSKSANILNLSVAVQMLKKDRGQIKLSVYDLFDENISVYRYASGNSVSTNEQEILKRYFLLTYQYKINVFKSK